MDGPLWGMPAIDHEDTQAACEEVSMARSWEVCQQLVTERPDWAVVLEDLLSINNTVGSCSTTYPSPSVLTCISLISLVISLIHGLFGCSVSFPDIRFFSSRYWFLVLIPSWSWIYVDFIPLKVTELCFPLQKQWVFYVPLKRMCLSCWLEECSVNVD